MEIGMIPTLKQLLQSETVNYEGGNHTINGMM